MRRTNKRAATPGEKGAASKTNGLKFTAAAARGASPARRFEPNVGQLIMLALSGIGGGL